MSSRSTGLTPVEVDGGFGDDVLSGRRGVDGYAAYGGPGDDTIDKLATNGDPIDVDGGSGDDAICHDRHRRGPDPFAAASAPTA